MGSVNMGSTPTVASNLSASGTLPGSSNAKPSGLLSDNVSRGGGTGVPGDMKTNPLANTGITQTEVGSSQAVSRNSTDFVDGRTVAASNREVDRGEARKDTAELTSPENVDVKQGPLNSEQDSKLAKLLHNASGNSSSDRNV